MLQTDFQLNTQLDLVFERVVDLPVELIWKAWTTPALITQWFCPAPWKTTGCDIDLRPGGAFKTTMQSPERDSFPNVGCYLEIVENKKLVWTNALLENFRPAPKSADSTTDFAFTAMLLLESQGAKTKYTAVAMHADESARKQHEAMGFQEGWGKALDQLITLMS